ncbi:MAG: UbiA family prenyltransferase [Actinobacteria bacterium]|nr:UbiA family prenyltransferase [Actinomycetota bacterium]MBU1608385.1 UbiA family prenyltransferase [Actinomycetota bacterium]MBU2316493.1 UbiA family prenyltransferase [Actinomycetota bacterium]MBU2386203.1 UbiA family prenyltransferase [Actinomycetota bacterium]
MLTRARALLGAAHLGPSVVVTVVSVALGVVSGLPLERVALLGAVILANQLSIGWSNDALDAERDRDAARADKPTVRGDVSPRTLLVCAVASATLAIALSLLLGLAAAAAHLVFLASGWTYNAGLKRTFWATACYVVGFASLPLIVTLARETPQPAAWWAVGIGGMLGLAAHVANVLPDLVDDARHGIRSLPHALGARASGVVALLALAAAAALGALGPPTLTPVGITGLAASAALLVAGLVVVARLPGSRALFRIIMASALTAVVTLAGAGSAILG